MQVTQNNPLEGFYLLLKSFLLWNFTLTVCLLVVGFPLVVLMVTVASLMAMVLQSIFPATAIIMVSAGLLGINILAIVIGSAILTLKGIRPEDISWLTWLHGKNSPLHNTIYASCPLTCNINQD